MFMIFSYNFWNFYFFHKIERKNAQFWPKIHFTTYVDNPTKFTRGKIVRKDGRRMSTNVGEGQFLLVQGFRKLYIQKNIRNRAEASNMSARRSILKKITTKSLLTRKSVIGSRRSRFPLLILKITWGKQKFTSLLSCHFNIIKFLTGRLFGLIIISRILHWFYLTLPLNQKIIN